MRVVSPFDNSSLHLCAYSTRAVFRLPRGLIPDTVMLAVIPDRGFSEHPLETGQIIMECGDNLRDRIAGHQTGSRVDFGLIASWLDFCATHHGRLCQWEDVTPIPGFSVIDCSARKVVLWSDLPKPADFVALSYVWGGVGDSRLNVNGTLPPRLPRLVGNSIELTGRLGFKYLWIDRYCIPQNDAEARYTQIQNMDVVFGSAAVTVIAAAGEDPTYGLPGVGSTPRNEQRSVRIGNRTLVSTSLNISRQVAHSKWGSRGWTYQEAYLSKRRLVFTVETVYFQCCAMHCLETISVPLKALHTKNLQRMRDSVNISRLWPLRGLGKSAADLDERIEEYAFKRQLTYSDDILNAFEGVLSRFKRMERPVRNILGVPVHHSNSITASLVVGLSWELYQSGDLRKRPGFPSWSWAGWSLTDPDYWHQFRFKLDDFSLGYERTNFQQDRSTLKHTTPLVDIDIQMADGALWPWAQTSDLIMEMASSGKNPPKFLHLTGYTAEARISDRPDKRGFLLPFINATDNRKSFLHRRFLGHKDQSSRSFQMRVSGEAIRLAGSVDAEHHPAKVAGQHYQFYHLRFVLLGFMDDGEFDGKPISIVMTMVVHRRQGSAAYERLAVIRTKIPRETGMLQDLRKGTAEELHGWKKCKTQIA